MCCQRVFRKISFHSPKGITNLASMFSNTLAASLVPIITNISTSQKNDNISSFKSNLSLVIITR
jgi:hypothetical protein